MQFFLIRLYPAADLGFFREGGQIFKIKKKIVDFLFRPTKKIFWALPNNYKDLNLTLIWQEQPNFRKKAKKAFLGTFWKISIKNS